MNEPSGSMKCWEVGRCTVDSFSRRAQLHEWVKWEGLSYSKSEGLGGGKGTLSSICRPIFELRNCRAIPCSIYLNMFSLVLWLVSEHFCSYHKITYFFRRIHI
jgi:hypothetical protein